VLALYLDANFEVVGSAPVNNLQRHEWPGACWTKNIFFCIKNVLAYNSAGVVDVNFEVVGSAPAFEPETIL
jgi:hypothetical protein